MATKKKMKLDMWKLLTIVMFAWLAIATYYLNMMYSYITEIWSFVSPLLPPTTETSIQFPTKSTISQTGYFLFAMPLLFNVIIAVAIIALIVIYGKL